MKLIISICLFATLLFANKTIVLKDGNKISGKVLSLQNGTYSIKTDSLGIIKIDEVQIDAIYSSNNAPQTNSRIRTQRVRNPRTQNFNPSSSAKLMNSGISMMNANPALVQQMMSNPNYVKIINNPDIIKAVQGGNMNAIFENEDFKTLMNSMSDEDIQMIQNSLGQ